MEKQKSHILFLCTGNSCRSQMAEGFARQLGAGCLEVISAGIEAHGKNPKAIAAMARIGIDISAQESTVVDDDMLEWSDKVITLCGHADEHCPALPGGTLRIHWPLPDPAKATGSEAEIEAEFDRVRDEIKSRIEGLIAEITASA